MVTIHIIYFNIKDLCILPGEYIYVFCMILQKYNNYFPAQHELVDFYNISAGFSVAYELSF